jgi:hypothetical protein
MLPCSAIGATTNVKSNLFTAFHFPVFFWDGLRAGRNDFADSSNHDTKKFSARSAREWAGVGLVGKIIVGVAAKYIKPVDSECNLYECCIYKTSELGDGRSHQSITSLGGPLLLWQSCNRSG